MFVIMLLGEFIARLAKTPNPEGLSDSEVAVLADESCRKYRRRPSFQQAKRPCVAASADIAARRGCSIKAPPMIMALRLGRGARSGIPPAP